jgi:uncharacterized protein (DUF1330 family)
MSAYVVLDVEVTDPEAYAEYKQQSQEALARHGGRFIVRGGDHEVLEGDWNPHRVVILEFATMEQARAWWSSDDYADAKALRQRASRGNMILVEGL